MSNCLEHLKNEEFHFANFKHARTKEHICLSPLYVAVTVPETAWFLNSWFWTQGIHERVPASAGLLLRAYAASVQGRKLKGRKAHVWQKQNVNDELRTTCCCSGHSSLDSKGGHSKWLDHVSELSQQQFNFSMNFREAKTYSNHSNILKELYKKPVFHQCPSSESLPCCFLKCTEFILFPEEKHYLWQKLCFTFPLESVMSSITTKQGLK